MLAEIKDPAALAVAALTAVAAALVQPNLIVAVSAGIAVFVVKTATGILLHSGTRTAPPLRPESDLTRREVEIARFVGLGLSNKEIAARLFISERTVDNHVQHILSKRQFHSRAQIAAWAAERGLLQK